MSGSKRRPEFRDWVDKLPDPSWQLMPLTHITKAFVAKDIIREAQIEPSGHPESLAYFFYARPAYRVHGDGAVKLEQACPFCFIFSSDLLDSAHRISAFDTGAFAARMYKPILIEEMNVDDFSLDKDKTRLNKLISKVFGNLQSYFDGDRTKVAAPDTIVEKGDFLPRALNCWSQKVVTSLTTEFAQLKLFLKKRYNSKNPCALLSSHTAFGMTRLERHGLRT